MNNQCWSLFLIAALTSSACAAGTLEGDWETWISKQKIVAHFEKGGHFREVIMDSKGTVWMEWFGTYKVKSDRLHIDVTDMKFPGKNQSISPWHGVKPFDWRIVLKGKELREYGVRDENRGKLYTVYHRIK